MSIAIAQMKICAGQPAQNLETMLQMIAEARQKGAEMILFPELSLSGLFPGDLIESECFRRECSAANARIAAAATDIMVVYGNLDERGGKCYNAVFLAYNQEVNRLAVPMGESFIRGAYDRFARSHEFQVCHLPLGGRICRVGFLLGDWRDDTLLYRSEDIDLLVDLSCKPLRLDDLLEQPYVPGRQYISVNGFGLQNSGKTNYLFAGGSYFRAPDGRQAAIGAMFASGLYCWNNAPVSAGPETVLSAKQLIGPALASGVREFCSLIHAQNAVIGISGGIDSALAACVYTQALGREHVWLVNMPTRFNSEQTKSLAEQMAVGLGTNYALLPIEANVNSLAAQIEVSPYRTAAGDEANFKLSAAALENVQARDRLRILAAVAAAVGGVVTCNGNKAELSVGYATFYGDLAGAFAAQADLWKYQVYQAAAGFQAIYPAAPLAEIAAIRPSAELSTEQDVTKGLGDPLIYRYHDYLLRAFVEQGLDPAAILSAYGAGELECLLGCEAGLSKELFRDAAAFVQDCEYWWRMYRTTGVAKRLQAPPLLALSRFPYGEEKPQAQEGVYCSGEYLKLKKELLA